MSVKCHGCGVSVNTTCAATLSWLFSCLAHTFLMTGLPICWINTTFPACTSGDQRNAQPRLWSDKCAILWKDIYYVYKSERGGVQGGGEETTELQDGSSSSNVSNVFVDKSKALLSFSGLNSLLISRQITSFQIVMSHRLDMAVHIHNFIFHSCVIHLSGVWMYTGVWRTLVAAFKISFKLSQSMMWWQWKI